MYSEGRETYYTDIRISNVDPDIAKKAHTYAPELTYQHHESVTPLPARLLNKVLSIFQNKQVTTQESEQFSSHWKRRTAFILIEIPK